MKFSGPDKCRYTLICFPAANYKKKNLKNFNVMICEWIYLEFLCPKGLEFVLEGGCCYSLWQISFQNIPYSHVFLKSLNIKLVSWHTGKIWRKPFICPWCKQMIPLSSKNTNRQICRLCIILSEETLFSGPDLQMTTFLTPYIKRNSETSAK